LKSTPKTKIKPKEMRLVDSGSTKADWIAIDEDGKIVYNTNFGLNPEVLRIMKLLIVSMIALIFCKIKKHSLFFYGAGCGTDKMKISLSNISKLFSKCYYFRRRYLCSGLCHHKRTTSHSEYSRNRFKL
jgi:hypothetical protein